MADKKEAAAPAKQTKETSHGDRLDALEKSHAALLALAVRNGWSV